MRLLTVEATNFCSYKEIEFIYTGLGLSLVSGPTGAGKSTLFDLVSWVLTGRTSKEGTADSVRAWDTNEGTRGIVEVETPTGVVVAVRTRKDGGNDFYWFEKTLSIPMRGKDLRETQELLDTRLGINSDLYFMGAYTSQFSKADEFFVAKAKDRRAVLEYITDLSFPSTLEASLAGEKKETRVEIDKLQSEVTRFGGKLEQNRHSITQTQDSIISWNEKRDATKAELQVKATTFESETLGHLIDIGTQIVGIDLEIRSAEPVIAKMKGHLEHLVKIRVTSAENRMTLMEKTRRLNEALGEIKRLNTVGDYCESCGRPHDSHSKKSRIDDLHKTAEALSVECDGLEEALKESTGLPARFDAKQRELNGNEDRLHELKTTKAELIQRNNMLANATNTYTEQLSCLLSHENPFVPQLHSLTYDREEFCVKLRGLTDSLKDRLHKHTSLVHLQDLNTELRGHLVTRVLSGLEEATNRCIERHFDAEIRISLTIESDDKVEVAIWKNGHECSFRQLSGGQRCLLKLAFSIALMKAASNKSGVHFSTLFFDEALNGLDDSLKVKAYGLFQELAKEHESILVIDHSEQLKNMFDTQFLVSMEGDHSHVSRM